VSNIAVIPARGGSKRIPRKNVKEFDGKPLIAWSIEAALKSGCFSKVLVSTDDQEIAAVAEKWGAEVPFFRPTELSDDYVSTLPVISHAVRWLDKNDRFYDYVCCIYATAPFLESKYLSKGLAEIGQHEVDYVISVTDFSYPPQRALIESERGYVKLLDPEFEYTRSQDLIPCFHDAAQFYWGRADAWRVGAPILSSRSVPIHLPRWRVQDLDTPEDWENAEKMFAANARKE
jgi:N-acylneuraminate cytidylyltransferase